MITNVVEGLAMIGEGLGLGDSGADRFAAVALHTLTGAAGLWCAFMVAVILR